MIDIKALVPQLQKQVELLTEDLIGQAKAVEATSAFLREHYDKAIETGRLSQSFEEWSEDYLEQVAVSWVLSCVFVRFLEDNHLIDECWIASEGDRGKLADGHYEIYFRSYPHHSDREYLKYVFKEVGKIPAARELFDDEKTPLWAVDPSGDAARRLLMFFKEIDAERGGLRRQFDTREVRTQPLVDVYEELAPQAQFLGDLYQDLSEHARKKYALLQTPEFVQQFILDRTLTPAIDELGLKGLRLIDPACGSGHFLLGAFDRLFALWMKTEEVRGNPVVAAQNAFDSLFGVDINPFGIAITRFRMLVAAVRACGINRLHQQSYAWKLNLAVGDSLLRGNRPSFGDGRHPILIQQEIEFEPVQKLRTEDPKAANEILGQGYHVVVGNPPYIIVRDRAQNAAYRQVYSTCHQKYSLGVPFTQRFWDLAIRKGERIKENAEAVSPAAGYVGMITANSFMKREFGKKLIEEFFPKIDLTHVIDTSGAYIPGHGTPTVILFGRARKPVDSKVRAVLGIRGEPAIPEDPTQGIVWRSIASQIDTANAQDGFTSTADVPRETFSGHPWSIGGGGASDLMEAISDTASQTLSDLTESIGITSFTLEDDVYILPREAAGRLRIASSQLREMVGGDMLRDWLSESCDPAIFPYDVAFLAIREDKLSPLFQYLWIYRANLGSSKMFGGKTKVQSGLKWYEYGRLTYNKLRTPLSIAFAEVATHNHFVLDRGGKVFKQSAPIIKLPADTAEEDHLALLGLLNSSTACFWLKQVMTPKVGNGIGRGLQDEKWEMRYQHSGTQTESFPVSEHKPLSLSSRLDEIARQLGELAASRILERWAKGEDLKKLIEEAEAKVVRFRGMMIALQEELDWECYRHYGMLADDLRYPGDDLPELKLGERAFEIVMARQMKRGELQTAWFERHGSTPITEIPTHWPPAYRSLIEYRIKLIETNKEIGLIERPEYKRRWSTELWADQVRRASENWLLDRLEAYSRSSTSELTTAARLADRASGDGEFMQVAALYRGRPDFDATALVAELVEAESVPLLPTLRYKPSGLRKREVWERTWDLQRREDAGEEVGGIPVPPKYTSADFLKTDYWRLRGKLDVQKERWVSYPHCQTDSDPSLVVGWAGWDHLEQATAIVTYYDARKREGWDARRLTPLLAGLDQLLPWIHQWHPEVDSEFGETAGASYQTLLEQDAHELGLTVEDIRNWQPPATTARRRGKK
ncbi:BREX-2 system adenine-specific DNA-methyltransferase PglX [bacterium]|nr:BREX-2 system adenine-specific DNA-methyltransferase PglX [bacterium]